MSCQCTLCLGRIIALCRQLILQAEAGASGCEQKGCLLLYGTILDSAYQIKAAAEHRARELPGSRTDH